MKIDENQKSAETGQKAGGGRMETGKKEKNDCQFHCRPGQLKNLKLSRGTKNNDSNQDTTKAGEGLANAGKYGICRTTIQVGKSISVKKLQKFESSSKIIFAKICTG